MRCRERWKRPGDVLPVRNSYHYPLPPGLEPGTLVRLVRHEHGYWVVEAKGKEFTVFKTLIVAGFEYEVRGRWLPEIDPEVQAAGKTREPRINTNRHEWGEERRPLRVEC
ncbi:MAG TPA: hypothetical protein VF773_20605 [Verrucomicrobiae bacterium]